MARVRYQLNALLSGGVPVRKGDCRHTYAAVTLNGNVTVS